MAKRGFLDGYKTYDPKKSGHGNPSQWRKAFRDTMGINEAQDELGADDPLSFFNFTNMPTMDELKRAYRKLMMVHHPDKGGNVETARKIIAAYTVLESRLQ